MFTGAEGVTERVAVASAQAATRFAGLLPAVSVVRDDIVKQLAGITKEDLQLLRKEGSPHVLRMPWFLA